MARLTVRSTLFIYAIFALDDADIKAANMKPCEASGSAVRGTRSVGLY